MHPDVEKILYSKEEIAEKALPLVKASKTEKEARAKIEELIMSYQKQA